jgi:hypothetical protein
LTGRLDDVPYDLFCMKDVDYTMKLMSTYGFLVPRPNAPDKQRTETTAGGAKVLHTFKYTVPFENHFLYRYCVDDRNNLRHSDVSLEETWVTH